MQTCNSQPCGTYLQYIRHTQQTPAHDCAGVLPTSYIVRSGESTTRYATTDSACRLRAYLPTHPPTRALRNNHPPLERRTHPYQTFCRCSAKRLPLLLPAELSSLDGRRHHIPAQAGSIGCGASSSGDARALCAWARARGLAAASYAIVLPLHTMRRVGIHRDVGISP